MYTGEQGEAWRNYLHRIPGVEPTREHVGRLPVAVAVERDTLADVKSDHLARLVVVGDSTFLSNRMIHIEGNRELAWHSVNWLLDRSNLLQGIGRFLSEDGQGEQPAHNNGPRTWNSHWCHFLWWNRSAPSVGLLRANLLSLRCQYNLSCQCSLSVNRVVVLQLMGRGRFGQSEPGTDGRIPTAGGRQRVDRLTARPLLFGRGVEHREA